MSPTNRQEANIEILKHLSQKIKDYPDIRFWQLLASCHIIEYRYPEVPLNIGSFVNTEVVDNFYEESEDTLEKIKKTL